ncbi:MAG: patatin-like phospholipase family protein [Deltaproteobacteria bacterium]|nr:patatin-like phospholipase family protein [Deltaproteobacteria bacterium]
MSSGFFGFSSTRARSRRSPTRASPGAPPPGRARARVVTGLRRRGFRSTPCARAPRHAAPGGLLGPPGAGLLQEALGDARRALPVTEIESARVAYAPSVFDLRARQTTVLREGSIAGAIHASCALPVLFHPVALGGRLYSDGGIADRRASRDLGGSEGAVSPPGVALSVEAAGSMSMKVPEEGGARRRVHRGAAEGEPLRAAPGDGGLRDGREGHAPRARRAGARGRGEGRGGEGRCSMDKPGVGCSMDKPGVGRTGFARRSSSVAQTAGWTHRVRASQFIGGANRRLDAQGSRAIVLWTNRPFDADRFATSGCNR